MTSPSPFELTDDYDVLRKRWLQRYLSVQGPVDTKFRTLLIKAGQDAHSRISALSESQAWSAGVKSAQLRAVGRELTKVFNDLFGKEMQITIEDGQKKAAVAAVNAFAETDRDYLSEAFGRSNVSGVIEGQRIQAMLGVSHAISRINKSDQKLSTRVYRTKRLADTWVKNEVNKGILRNASAKEIADSVRKSIRPNTPGGVAYAAMRLGRTEINNAFHATTVALSQDRPWVENMAWNLSAVHEDNDSGVIEICERYARQTFEVNSVPAKPHPQCRCFVTPQVESYDVFLDHLTAGQYRDWISNAA